MLLKGHLGIKSWSSWNPIITRSSDSFSTVLPVANGSDWGCIVRDLETIIVLVLLAFNFIPERSHRAKMLGVPVLHYTSLNKSASLTLTLKRSQIRNSAAVTLTPADATTAIIYSGDIGITDQAIFQSGKKLRGVQNEQ